MRIAILFAVAALGVSVPLFSGAFDGEQVYKSNCTRCHTTIRTYPNKMSRSIVRHMRIKAQLTGPEAEAVLAYLSESFRPARKPESGKAEQ